jgi:hypothetical protein
VKTAVSSLRIMDLIKPNFEEGGVGNVPHSSIRSYLIHDPNAICDFLRMPVNPALPSSPTPPNLGRRELEMLPTPSSLRVGRGGLGR